MREVKYLADTKWVPSEIKEKINQDQRKIFEINEKGRGRATINGRKWKCINNQRNVQIRGVPIESQLE